MLVWQGSQAFTIACRSSRYLHKAVNRENLTSAEAQAAMQMILSGDATTAQIAAFLVALRMKGETADELVGFARAMRARWPCR